MAPPHYGSAQNDVTFEDAHDEEMVKSSIRKPSQRTESSTEECTDPTGDDTKIMTNDAIDPNVPTNEYVLNVAFVSFVGFMAVQAFFALVANSQSMLADSEAMSVDALTYLFNMCAERIKNRPPTAEELQLPLAVREHRIEMKRLYLELVPPLISVSTLIVVTIAAVKEAWGTLFGDATGEEDDVSAGLMLFFSGLNLLLDVVNVTCFARAHQAYGLQKTAPVTFDPRGSNVLSERTGLLDDQSDPHITAAQGSDLIISEHETHDSLFERLFGNVNLNMCSAWTHICADTMRSAAVLVAAGIAETFDGVDNAVADSCAAIAVSITILLSLIPLIRGLFVTARQIVIESKNKPAFILETQGGTQYHV